LTGIRLGSINGSLGLKGWVKVFSYTDPMDAILSYSPWTLKKGGEQKQVEVIDGRVQGKRLVAQLKDVADRNQADGLVGYEIHVDINRLPELQSGDFYWHQLQDFVVRNKEHVVFGKVDHLLETGASDVLVVKATIDSVDDRQRLIPFAENVEVNQDAGEIVVDWEVDY
jgi:16S rRNA processing protein RimM